MAAHQPKMAKKWRCDIAVKRNICAAARLPRSPRVAALCVLRAASRYALCANMAR